MAAEVLDRASGCGERIFTEKDLARMVGDCLSCKRNL